MIEQGEQAPDFELADQDDQPVRLSGLRGRRVLLRFRILCESSPADDRLFAR